jgi:hypothetical protein
MKLYAKLPRYICLLVIVLLAAILPSLAVPMPPDAGAITDAGTAPQSVHTLGMNETSLPSILMVSFGLLILYTAYRYWTDNHGQHKVE